MTPVALGTATKRPPRGPAAPRGEATGPTEISSDASQLPRSQHPSQGPFS